MKRSITSYTKGGDPVKLTAPSGPANAEKSIMKFTPKSRGDAYLMDSMFQVLGDGVPRHVGANYDPEEQKILQDAYIWRKMNGTGNVKADIQNYFNRPVNPQSSTDTYRQRLNKIGGGALSLFNQSPDIGVQALNK